MSDLGNEALKSAERTLMDVAETVLSGATLRIIEPLHDDRHIVVDSLLKKPYIAEIVEALRDSKPGLISYVDEHLFPVAYHYRSVATYLEEKHGFNPGSDTYKEWLAKLVDRSNEYLQAEYLQLKNADDEWQIDGHEKATDPELEDLDVLAAVAVIDSADQIVDRLVVSDRVVSCKLDAIVRLADLHYFCDTSFKLLNIEIAKKAGGREMQSMNRHIGHANDRKVREEIRDKLSGLLCGKDSSQYFHSKGKKTGRPDFKNILKVLEREIWNLRAPCTTVMRDEIRKFCANL